jgi:hypothetical protein
LRSVQKLHSETALITPYNGAIKIQSSTWNAQPKCRGHDRRAIDLDNRRGIREVPDLASHKTAVDQYLRSIDVTSPLIRHVSQSPPLYHARDIDRRFQSQMRLDHGFIARLRVFSLSQPEPPRPGPALPAPSRSRLRPTTLYPRIEGLIGDPFAREPKAHGEFSSYGAGVTTISIVLRDFEALVLQAGLASLFFRRGAVL